MFKKLFLGLVSIILHLSAIGLIIYFLWPIARWYLDRNPAVGIDLYLSASYVSHLLKDFAFRFNGWKEFWFAGVPYASDYPTLYFYWMIPFVKLFGLITGIQRFAIFGLFVFSAFSYLLYHELSKNRFLAIVLTLATVFSGNLYKSLIWAGGIPFWTTQAFFPMVLFFIVKFCQSENRRWFYLAALASGLGILGHPQSFINVILPSVFILLFFWRPLKQKFSLIKRFLDIFVFGILSFIISLPFLSSWLPLNNLGTIFSFLGNFIIAPLRQEKATGDLIVKTPLVEAWTRDQFKLVYSDAHPLLFILLVFFFLGFFLSLLLRKNRLKSLWSLAPFILLAGWLISMVFLYSRGFNVYVTGWYKAFWPTLVGLAMLIAFLWGEIQSVFTQQEFWQGRIANILKKGVIVAFNLFFVGIIVYLITFGPEALLSKLEFLDTPSSAYPEVLNVKTKDDDLLSLKNEFWPKLITDNPRDFRLYVIDARVNLWWGALQEMPLTRGYVDPPIDRGGIFWLDAALGPGPTKPGEAAPKSSLIEDWKTPEEVADNNLRFLLDWYGTKYLEGNQRSASNTKFGSNFASNIITDKFIEADEEIMTSGEITNQYPPYEKWAPEGFETLHYYRIKSDLVSPILMTTNAAPVLHLGDKDGYENLTRLLGALNLGPRKIILVKGPKFLEETSPVDLQNFSAVFIYKYDYHNYQKSWKMLENYVKNGGNVFIDTGSEVKESDTSVGYDKFSAELPSIFPISEAIRRNLGENWEAEAAVGNITAGIEFDQFSPLVFDNGPWNISYPDSESNLRKNAQVILKQKGKIVVTQQQLGKGKVIWSGLNLPYHALRDYNPQEGKFFYNILDELVDFGENRQTGKTTWISPRERKIGVSGEKGVLFKEQAFDGWEASFEGKNLKIYKAGPSDPGFMYAKLPENATGTVRFVFGGALASKIYSGISILVIILILDYTSGMRIFYRLTNNFYSSQRKHVGRWWEQEEE